MNTFVRDLLYVCLLLLALGTLLAQVLVPLYARDTAMIYPEVEHLVVPYSIAGIAAIVCAQVALACVWRLLIMVAGGRIFTRDALRWVSAIIAAAGVAALICAATFWHMGWVERIGGPMVAIGLASSVVGGAAFMLLMTVMRSLLDAAIVDRDELAEVI